VNEINEAPELSLTETGSTRARVDSDTDSEKKDKRAPAGAVRHATDKSAGSRLAKDWHLPEPWQQWAVEHHQIDAKQIASEAHRFRDYWVGVPGQKGRKADWEATWRNWLRRNYPEKSAHPSTSDVKRPADFWWRTKPDMARKMPPEVWRKAVANFANGVWPVETLGPPPGTLECLVPPDLVAELRLTEIYNEKGAKRK
jgi:hypothetical protein